MLSKCANPSCREEFHSLRRGRLFVAEPTPPMTRVTTATAKRHKLEYFWLCAECCRTMRVALDRHNYVVVTSLHGSAMAAPVTVVAPAVLDRR